MAVWTSEVEALDQVEMGWAWLAGKGWVWVVEVLDSLPARTMGISRGARERRDCSAAASFSRSAEPFS